jgi:DNA-binding LacI/PurR family transcriptional regulator
LRALHVAGRRVPADVGSLVGFDDIPEARYLHTFTTVRQDFDEVDARASACLQRSTAISPSRLLTFTPN